jgi:hypothetical protein
MPVRTAIIRLVNVSSDNVIIYKNKSTIDKVINSSEMLPRVFEYESGSAPNAASGDDSSAPSIHEYLNSEDSDGYNLVHLDQYFIITQN